MLTSELPTAETEVEDMGGTVAAPGRDKEGHARAKIARAHACTLPYQLHFTPMGL